MKSCPRHNLTLERRDGIYGEFWACPLRPKCDVIGDWCQHDGKFRLSDQPTRDARKMAHAAFDRIWKGGYMTRSQAYKSLGSALGLSKKECHIKHFDAETCRRVIRWARKQMEAVR